jgi:hypothetical protein
MSCYIAESGVKHNKSNQIKSSRLNTNISFSFKNYSFSIPFFFSFLKLEEKIESRRLRDRMVVGFTTTYAIKACVDGTYTLNIII